MVSSSRARVVLSTNRPSFLLGENVLVHYCVENLSSEPLTINVGGDYRGSSRSLRFQVTVTDSEGKVVADPDPEPFNLGGVSYSPELAPGASWCKSLPLLRYARIERPGLYRVRIVHDLGWKSEAAPAGETQVRFEMPNERQAREVIGKMRALLDDPRSSAGKKSVEWSDFTTLSHPVYLAPLEELAKKAFLPSIDGIGSIPTPEATRALIALVRHADRQVRLRAAHALSLRLPDPALEGALPPRNPFFNELPEQRKFLIERSWRADMAVDVRQLARTLLASRAEEEQKRGAFFVEAVGEPVDAPAIAAALDVAIDKTRTTPREEGIFPVPRGACQELLRAAQILVSRGYQPPAAKSPGELAMWLVGIGQGLRPKGWVATMHQALAHPIAYLREQGLRNLPYAPAFAADLHANFAHLDVDVRIAACDLVRDRALTGFAPDLLVVIESAPDDWLLRTASGALAQLGVQTPRYEAIARRLGDPELSEPALSLLLDVFDQNGRSASEKLTPEMAKALQPRWLAFLRKHRAAIDGRRELSLDEAPRELVPAGWTIHREGKPDWP